MTKCQRGIPYPSLIATILLYAGVALFCGCGHEALSGTVTILQNYFEVIRGPGDGLDVIDIIKYVIYGIASAFFVYGILLMVEGFFTSGAIKDLYGDFKITTCGRCVSAWLLYVGLNWNGINYLLLAFLCCFLTFSFYICACFHFSLSLSLSLSLCLIHGETLGMSFCCHGNWEKKGPRIHYLMVLSANWAYVKDACKMQKYEDCKSKEEQELHDIHSTRSKERLNAYT
uniref:Glycoprotein M6Aa n=1 Tax=Cyprinus carpio TaxID=7962 RepID=A0A8C1PU46_CYPCA